MLPIKAVTVKCIHQNDWVKLSQVMLNVVHHLNFETTWMQLQLHKHIIIQTLIQKTKKVHSPRMCLVCCNILVRTSHTQIM